MYDLPDVMASDITGFTMFNKEENRFEYRSGLVMTNILLADEIIFQWENQEVFVDFFDYPEQLFPFFNITDKI